MTAPTSGIFRFGDFDLDLAAYEIRRGNRPLKLTRQQMDLLILLIERRGQLVSRAEIAERLWKPGVFVDMDTAINSAVSRIRQALTDSAEAPRFVETVPAKGYRFIADVTVKDSVPSSGLIPDMPRPSDVRRWPRWQVVAAGVVLAATVVAVFLTWPRASAGAVRPAVTIAVLPFVHLGDPGTEYLADGLTSETSASLAQIDPERLSVKGRTLAYKETRKAAMEIGFELGADYLVEGTVHREGPRVRVTAQVLRARDEAHVWSAAYERDSTALLALQRELSAVIAAQIRHRLSPDSVGAPGRRHTYDPAAYDAYLRARYLQGRRMPEANAQAVHEFERALALDPSYALAWAGLALTHATSVLNGDVPSHVAAPRARFAAARAVEENADLAEAQMAAAYVSWLFDWDWATAAAAAERATRIDPSSGAAWRILGHILSQSGRHPEAASAMVRARDLEPLEPMTYAVSSQVAFQARDFEAGLEHARRAVAVDPDMWIGYMMLGQAYERLGQTDLALEALADAARLSQGNSKPVSLRAYVLAHAGRIAQAREVLRTLLVDGQDPSVRPYALALVHTGLRDREAAFEWLGKAYANRDVHLMFLGVDPKWDSYRQDARFAAFLSHR